MAQARLPVRKKKVRSLKTCSVRKRHRCAFPKSPQCYPTSQSVSFDYYYWKGDYLVTRFHHTLHSANKQTLRARAALGQMWSPAHLESDWSPGYSVTLPFTSSSSSPPSISLFSLSLNTHTRSERFVQTGMISGKERMEDCFICLWTNKAIHL